MATQPATPPRVVIVGGGFGGIYAARALARHPVRVTVLDRLNYHLFQPLLYQVATAALSPGEIAQPIRAILRRYRNVDVVLGEVTRVDLAGRRVFLGEAPVPYDYLILAPGASHSYFGHDEWAALAPGLKRIDDALEIRRRILFAYEQAEREPDPAVRSALLTFVVVGAGPTGVELAGAIAEIARETLVQDFRHIDPAQSRILLLEAGPRVLPTFPDDLSRRAAGQLRDLGVEVRTGAQVTGITPREVRIGQEGETIPTRTALWAAGVQASPLLRSLDLPLDRSGRVAVEPDLTLLGHPEVSVIGDVALFTHQGGKPLPGVAQVAIQQGKAAAENIWRDVQGLPRRPFRYRDLGNMATIGRKAAVADLGRVRLWGLPAWVLWLVVHIYWLIGFDNRLLVITRWALSYFTHSRGARLITGPIESPLPVGPALPPNAPGAPGNRDGPSLPPRSG
jgi:NADH:ubiquinone reductase (H+-translocating)